SKIHKEGAPLRPIVSSINSVTYNIAKHLSGILGTGVFYQAMPAVGADGKNIMKLIPVQMVNRQFYQMIRKVSLINGLPNQVGPDICSSLKKCPQQQKTVNLISKVPPVPTPAANCENPRFSSQLPVTVTSPALPRGQYLQIPPNAQVRTVPGSELPLVIKKQIFTTSANSSPGSGLPSVVYVSPINTVNQSVTSPSDSALQSLKLVSKTPNVTYSGHPSKGPQKHLKLVPKVAQRPNSPLKWMVEEEDNPVSPSLDPLNSPSMTSEILLAVAERENASRHCNVITKPTSQSSQSKSGQGQENALVMCNGKVYFVAKNSSHIKLKSNHLSTLKCSSGQKPLKGNPRAVESQPVIGFVEPIDEDFLSTDENDIPNSQDMDVGPQTLTCVDVNTNTRRMGRTRKRTMCPCCIPCTEIPAVKSNAKSLEPEKWSPTAEKMSKKGGRAKVVRKDEKTSGRLVCLTAKNRQKCKPLEVPATDNLSTRSMECDELTRLEKIERLKRLLREKEAALELMRNSMS
uniref:Ligand dependent nuclear receptor interacting factor 1 n=1 Tax=Mola mola TaxID=94237 RepID=A0A3Q3X728_MOLML